MFCDDLQGFVATKKKSTLTIQVLTYKFEVKKTSEAYCWRCVAARQVVLETTDPWLPLTKQRKICVPLQFQHASGVKGFSQTQNATVNKCLWTLGNHVEWGVKLEMDGSLVS